MKPWNDTANDGVGVVCPLAFDQRLHPSRGCDLVVVDEEQEGAARPGHGQVPGDRDVLQRLAEVSQDTGVGLGKPADASLAAQLGIVIDDNDLIIDSFIENLVQKALEQIAQHFWTAVGRDTHRISRYAIPGCAHDAQTSPTAFPTCLQAGGISCRRGTD